MEMESAESVIHKFGQIYPNEVDEVLGEHYEWSLNIYKEDIQKTAYYAYKYGLLLHEYIMKQPKEMFTTEPNEEKEQKIKKYLTKGVELLEKVESITVDISIETDAFTKLGDIYLYSNKYNKAQKHVI